MNLKSRLNIKKKQVKKMENNKTEITEHGYQDKETNIKEISMEELLKIAENQEGSK